MTTFDTDDGAVPGEYNVAVRKVQVISGGKPVNASDDYAGPPPNEKWLLPAKFGQSATSGLKATVKEGENNEFQLELQD